MAGMLTFDLAALKPLAAHASSATNFKVGLELLYDAQYHKGGVIVTKDGAPDPDNIDRTKLKPALELVKDHGVYLMSNGLPGLPAGENVVYANEANPKTMAFDDWYDASVDILGGDDCVITLDVTRMILHGLARRATKLAVCVDDSSVRAMLLKRRPEKPMGPPGPEFYMYKSAAALRKAERRADRRTKASKGTKGRQRRPGA